MYGEEDPASEPMPETWINCLMRASRASRANSCGSCYMDRTEGLLAALHIETHGVHDALDSRHGSGNGAIIIDVGMDRLDAEPNVGEKGFGAFRMPRRDSYRKFALEQMLDDVAAEKASPAEYGHLPSCHRSGPRRCRRAVPPQAPKVGGKSMDGWLLALPTTSPTNRNTACF